MKQSEREENKLRSACVGSEDSRVFE